MASAKAHLEWLRAEASTLGAPLTELALTQFAVYLEELRFWSPKVDLVAQTDPLVIIRKHFLDSLAVTRYLPPVTSVLDLGSGAGFPGIPLALALPQVSVTLLEARRKRVSFLRHLVRSLGAKNLKIQEGRAEILAQERSLQEAFEVVTTRATWNIATLLGLSFPFLRQAGQVFALRGPRTEAQASLMGKEQEKFVFLHAYQYTLPGGSEQRALFIFGKKFHVTHDGETKKPKKVSRDT